MPEVSNTGLSANDNCDIKVVCRGCGLLITDRYFYNVAPDSLWHETCLVCTDCGCKLNESITCFMISGKIYCKSDYEKQKSAIMSCKRCSNRINQNELYIKTTLGYFHTNCFSCNSCNRKFQVGDNFATRNDMILCNLDGQCGGSNYLYGQNLTLPNLNTTSPLVGGFMHSSTMSITPESSVSSLSQSSFSPTSTNSTASSSSSVVDSPSNLNPYCQLNNYNLNNTFSSTSSQQNFQNSYNLESNNANLGIKQDLKSFSDYDFQDKEDEDSITDEEEDSDEEDIDDNDNSISEESSLNESVNSMGKIKNNKLKSNGGLKHKSKLLQQNGFSSSSPSSSSSSIAPIGNGSLLQINHSHMQTHHSHHHHHHGNHHHGHHSSKPARVRTVLNEKQLQMLKAFYTKNPRPDALMKEQLVEITGLNPRVIRVWFQNKRCKDKKKNMSGRPDHQSNQIQIPTQFQNSNNNSNNFLQSQHIMNHHHHHQMYDNNCF